MSFRNELRQTIFKHNSEIINWKNVAKIENNPV